MYFRQLLNDDTSCASYLFGCLTHGKLAVVDPHVDLVDDYRRLADLLGRIGRRCRDAGARLSYHNHAFEFVRLPADEPTAAGTTAFALDLLLGWTDPELVKWEPDVYWIARAGEDPVAYLDAYAGRCPLVHLKDYVDRESRADVPVGDGVVGYGELVGAPLSVMLAQDSIRGNATVTITHVRTRDLGDHTRRADILVAAAGIPEMITGEMVKPGATVVDVGVHRTDDGIVGDVKYAEVSEVAGAITPVPGGVGPMTVAMLMVNTVTAAEVAAYRT
jgi:hypothetical protein